VLLKQSTLAGIAAGTIKVVYRRWQRPRVQAGSTFRTSIGVIEIEKIEPIAAAKLTDRAARSAGFESRAELMSELARYGEGPLHRISVGLVGADPRVALRRKSRLTADERAQLREQLERIGTGSAAGPHGLELLRLIAAEPGVRAEELAARVGMEKLAFKARVRRLKELGLTESLEVGYRVSPRGRALLRDTQKGGAR
jgi:hypothetical protein